MKTLRATRAELESRLEEVRVKEMGAQASASALRADLEAHGGAPSSANTTQTEEKKVSVALCLDDSLPGLLLGWKQKWRSSGMCSTWHGGVNV